VISQGYTVNIYKIVVLPGFFAQIHFGAIAILGLTALTYFGAIDPTLIDSIRMEDADQ
jgi:hypothetical protein